MSKKFTKKNSQKYVVVHRPHDDPHYYDQDASAHVFVPVVNPNAKKSKSQEQQQVLDIPSLTTESFPLKAEKEVGEAAIYGIEFDDTKYDYMQHLKPIGGASDSIFIPSKKPVEKTKKKDIEDFFVEPEYKDVDSAPIKRVFERGVGKPEYLAHQQNITDEIKGFRPDMNPALREVLEALEDEAYVVNEDIEVKPSKKKSQKDKKTKEIIEQEENKDDEDDVFNELLAGGEVHDEEAFDDQFDEWDMDNFDNYEDEHYKDEMAQFDNVENLQDLQDIDYQADVRRFQKEKKNMDDEFESDNEFGSDDNASLAGKPEEDLDEEEEDGDVLADLPTIKPKTVKSSKKKKERRKKGAMSDISGFSMSSSAIARTETMTVLDDQYDNIINGYENYEDELAEDEEVSYQPFDMKEERSDFESLVDDFLDNYVVESGGRKLVKKDDEVQRFKDAADSVSKGKLSQRRNRERQQKAKDVNNITNSLNSLRF